MMKQWTTGILAALSLATAVTGNEYERKALKIKGLYQAGLAAMKDGEINAARAAFTEVLSLDPNHGHARYQLGQLKGNQGRVLMARRRALFKTTKIKKVDFEDTPLLEVIETLNFLTAEATGKKFTPNFIIQDSKGTLKNAKVTLSLSNVPLEAALKYSLEQVGAGVRYDTHATIISPRARTKGR